MLFHVTALAVIGCKSSTADTVRAAVFFIMDICFFPPLYGISWYLYFTLHPPKSRLKATFFVDIGTFYW